MRKSIKMVHFLRTKFMCKDVVCSMEDVLMTITPATPATTWSSSSTWQYYSIAKHTWCDFSGHIEDTNINKKTKQRNEQAYTKHEPTQLRKIYI